MKELLSNSQGPNEGKSNQYIFLTFFSGLYKSMKRMNIGDFSKYRIVCSKYAESQGRYEKYYSSV